MSRQKLAPSLQMRLFSDPDFAKPQHDQIMHWVDKLARSQPERFARFLYGRLGSQRYGGTLLNSDGVKKSWERELGKYHDVPSAHARDFLQPFCESISENPPALIELATLDVVWEWPVRSSSYSKREEGFVDLKVNFLHRYAVKYGVVEVRDIKPDRNYTKASGKPEYIARKGTGILGDAAIELSKVSGTIGVKDGALEFVHITDLSYKEAEVAEFKGWVARHREELLSVMDNHTAIDDRGYYRVTGIEWRIETENHSVYIEVKPDVPSASQLIRQLRVYEDRGARPLIVAAPPNEELAKLLREQRFGFLPYEGDGVSV